MKSNLFTRFKLIPVLLLAASVGACKKDKNDGPSSQQTPTQGMFILNEGNAEHNNSSLDYYDYQSAGISHDIFGTANDGANLGDIGQDVQVYGSKIYLSVNGSNLVEIIDAATLKKVKEITSIDQPRYIVFNKNKAFVSSYDDHVYVIDTASLNVEKSVAVGKDPEHMAIANNKLYVANSGGTDFPASDNTVSVIDLNTLEKIKTIEVATNLNEIASDKYGDVYVISRGNYQDVDPDLYIIDSKTDEVKKDLQIPATGIAVHDDLAYIYEANYSFATNSYQLGYLTLDVKDETVVSQNFITDGSDKLITVPYAIAVDPTSGDIYIADAKDYQNPGKVYCFDKNGKKKFSFTAGVIPGHFAFYSNRI